MGNIFSFFKSIYIDTTSWKEIESIDIDLLPPIDIPAHLVEILNSQRNYTGCATYIKEAISNPSSVNDAAVCKKLNPCILDIRKYYQISCEIDTSFYQIIKRLSADDFQSKIESHRLDLERLSALLEFYAEFDWLKLSNPALQNDFSYYRRSLSKIKESKSPDIIIIPDEETNYISLFLAQMNPMTVKIISNLKMGIQKVEIKASSILQVFFTIAAACYLILSKHKNNDQNQINIHSKCKIMTICCIIYDHIDPNGVFAKTSKIDMKSVVDLLFNIGLDQEFSSRILNTLKYSSPNFNNDSTPKIIKQKIG